MSEPKYPTTIYVRAERDTTDGTIWLNAEFAPTDFTDDGPFAVYELKEYGEVVRIVKGGRGIMP